MSTDIVYNAHAHTDICESMHVLFIYLSFTKGKHIVN